MADLDFFFDPVCPWAWITSRWVVEVEQQREYEVNWRFISLKMINADRPADDYTAPHRAAHLAGLYTHRVCDEVRLRLGNAAVGALYTALGTAFHNQQRRPEINDAPEAFMAEMLANAGLPTDYAVHVHDDSHDAYIEQDTELAFSRTGRDVGTPIITFHPGATNEASFFGPVISVIPRGAEATKLWDAIETIATSTGVAELKRSIRSAPVFD
ncbi:MAG: DsbA family protein [Ilumatobacteraceae bacterium]